MNPARRGNRSAPAWMALLVAGVACKGAAGAADAQAELKSLERLLADTASLELHPVLTDADLEPLRRLLLRDGRIDRARDACVRQYEAILRAQEDLARCRSLEDMLERRMRDMSPDAADPALILAEAQDVCGRAFRATEHIDQARRECDDAIGAVRDVLGLPR